MSAENQSPADTPSSSSSQPSSPSWLASLLKILALLIVGGVWSQEAWTRQRLIEPWMATVLIGSVFVDTAVVRAILAVRGSK